MHHQLTSAGFCALDAFLSGGTFDPYSGNQFSVVLTEHGHELRYRDQVIVSRGPEGVFTQFDTLRFAQHAVEGEAAAVSELLRSVGAKHAERSDLWVLHDRMSEEQEKFYKQRRANHVQVAHRGLSFSN